MVYVYSKQSKLNKYIGKDLSVEEIKDTLVDLGMDIKGESEEADPELKIEITAEKMDLVSAIGIARAIKYYKGFEKKLPKYEVAKAKNKVIVDESVNGIRPKTACVILRDFEISQEILDEMIEIQEKIHDSFGRNRKKVSIGIYPMDEFEFPVHFKALKPEEIVFRPLEHDSAIEAREILKVHDTGKKFAHLLDDFDYFPCFSDKSGKILSLVPVINSHETGRVQTHHRDLFIECSGHNLTYLDHILKVMLTSFIEMGAKAEAVSVEYPNGEVYEVDLSLREEELELDYVNKLIGVDITEDDVEELLNKAQYELKEIKDGKITTLVPAYKADVWHDVDIADDIARAYGYNNILVRSPNVKSIGGELKSTQFKRRFTNTMINMGFIELYTYILSSTKTQFENMEIQRDDYIRLIDSEDQGINMTRINIIPDILTSLHINRKNKYPQRVFESGFTIQVDESKDTGARNESHLAVAIADSKANYTQIKGVLDSLLSLNEVDFEVLEVELPFLIEGRCAKILVSGVEVGFIGELHPQVLENFGLLVPVSILELNLDKVFELQKP